MPTLLVASQLIGGVALFLYGVNLLSGAMEKISGARLQEILEKLTANRLKGILLGIAATGIFQSSSLLMVTMIGLINSGLMSLNQAVGVMLGQEIGTTVTAQLIAFKVGDLCFLLIAIGVFLSLILERRKNFGEIFLSLGILFLGMKTMSAGVKSIEGEQLFSLFLSFLRKSPLIAILIGAIITAIIQSSSAFTGLVIAIGSVGAIDLTSAISLILGANLGTCVTGWLAAFKLSSAAKQTSMAQILINFGGVLIFLPFLKPFTEIVSRTSTNLPRQVANAHTIFNVAVSTAFFPFVGQIVSLSQRLVPAETEEGIKFLDDRILEIPHLAIREALGKALRLGDMTEKMLENSQKGLLEGNLKAAQKALAMEEKKIDKSCNLVEAYLDDVMEKNLSDEMVSRCIYLLHNVTDIERVADLANNLAEAALEKSKRGIKFSARAQKELARLFERVREGYRLAVECLEHRDEEIARRVLLLEDEVDELEKRFRENHLERLEQGTCQPEANVIFVEALRDLERISDHADNLAGSVLGRGYGT